MGSEKFNFGWVVLAAGFCVHLCLGTANCWGNVSTYVTSYIRANGDPGVTYAETFWVFGSLNAAQSVMVVLGGFIQKLAGPRLTCMLGACMVGAAAMISSVTVGKSLWLFTLTYGVLFGFGVGTAYTCPMAAALAYMPTRNGLVNGVITLGFGLGAFLFNFLITWFINPHGCQPVCDGQPFVCPSPPGGNISVLKGCTPYFPGDSEIVQRVPQLFLTLGSIFAGVGIIFGSLVRPPSEAEYEKMEQQAEIPKPRASTPPHQLQKTGTIAQPEGLTSAVAGEWAAAWQGHPEKSPRAERSPKGEQKPLLNSSTPARKYGPPSMSLGSRAGGVPPRLNSPTVGPRKTGPGSAAPSRVSRHSRFSRASTVKQLADEATSVAGSWYPQGKPAPELTLSELALSPVGWQLWFGFFCAQFGATYVVGQFKVYGQEQPWSTDEFQQLVSSMMALSSGLGSCLHGIACDTWGFAVLHIANTAIQWLTLLSFSTAFAVSSPTSWMIWCCVSAFCFGGSFSVFPTATCALAGREHFGTNYGFVFTGFGAQSLVLATISSVSPDLGFVPMTRIGGALCFVAMLNGMGLLYRETEAEEEVWYSGSDDAEDP